MGRLYIVSAPSGAGKSSLLNALLEQVSDVKISISTTTRAKRPGEEDGKHYHFESVEQFEAKIKQDEFLDVVTKSTRAVVHFYHREFQSCKVADMHLQKMERLLVEYVVPVTMDVLVNVQLNLTKIFDL